MLGKAHLLCSSLSNFSPDETKQPCLILLQGYVVVGNPASPKSRNSHTQVEIAGGIVVNHWILMVEFQNSQVLSYYTRIGMVFSIASAALAPLWVVHTNSAYI